MCTKHQIDSVISKAVFSHSDLKPLLLKPILQVIGGIQEAQGVDVAVGLDDDQVDLHVFNQLVF
jgi:hypothetical protein